jgi:hypothetical protein
MNRYKVTYDNNKTLLLYKNSPEEIATKDSIGTIISIQLYTDNSHEHYISEIKKQSSFMGYDYKNRECYRCNYYKGYLVVKFSKDISDEKYYDFAEYQEFIDGRILQPTTYTLSTPKKIYELLSIKKPEYIVYSHRYYGEPKLSKPKELKNINSIGSAVFIPKKCNPQVFVTGNDIWIKHNDYFSGLWRPPEGERIGMPLSYYANKYFNSNKKEKFVYADTWGGIVLRNEAWIQLKNFLPLVETESYKIFADAVIKKQKKDFYSKSLELSETELEWHRFYESVYKTVKNSKDNIKQ